MTDCPITPPPELVRHWSRFQGDTNPEALWFRIANEAAQWGADQELEACCEWFITWDTCEGERLASLLRDGRRPKPPSLKEQALALLDPSTTYGSVTRDTEYRISVTKAEIIRRALEQLDD